MVSMRQVGRLGMLLPLFSMMLLSGCSQPTEPTVSTGLSYLSSVWGSSAHDVYAVGEIFDEAGATGVLAHYNGEQWTVERHVRGGILTDLWGTSETERFAVGYEFGGAGKMLRFNGNGPVSRLTSESRSTALYSVWGSSANDVYAAGGASDAGRGLIEHFDGTSWTTVNDTLNSWAVWGSGAHDVYVLGNEVLHFDGLSWTSQGINLLGIHLWGSGPNDVFVVGAQGAIQHFDGVSWSTQPSGTQAWLRRVWGLSATNVYAVGDDGVILHYDGARWSTMASATSKMLHGIWGSAANDIYAVGMDGAMVHYDGSRWSSVQWNTPRDWTKRL